MSMTFIGSVVETAKDQIAGPNRVQDHDGFVATRSENFQLVNHVVPEVVPETPEVGEKL